MGVRNLNCQSRCENLDKILSETKQKSSRFSRYPFLDVLAGVRNFRIFDVFSWVENVNKRISEKKLKILNQNDSEHGQLLLLGTPR